MCLDASQHVLGRRLNHRQGVRPRRSVGVAVTVVQCKGCGLIFTNPRPVPQSLGDHYEKPPEEYWRPEQLEERTDHGAIPFDTFQTLHKPQPHTLRALDVGAGLGQDMLQLN
jgi:hypothetical protein